MNENRRERPKQPRPISPQQIAVRSGGIGDVLSPGVVRKTARAGIHPLAVPRGMARLILDRSYAADAVERQYLNVAPDVPLTYLTIEDAILARRHWPEYRVVMIGVDLRHVNWGGRIPEGIYLPIYPSKGHELQTYGTRILRLCTRIYWNDSPIYGEFLWQPGWNGERSSTQGEGVELRCNQHAVLMAQRGLELFQGIPPRGRTAADREEELVRLARLGLRWARVSGKGRSPDDITWPVIALTDADRPVKKIQARASKRNIGIEDVRRRAREIESRDIQ